MHYMYSSRAKWPASTLSLIEFSYKSVNWRYVAQWSYCGVRRCRHCCRRQTDGLQ